MVEQDLWKFFSFLGGWQVSTCSAAFIARSIHRSAGSRAALKWLGWYSLAMMIPAATQLLFLGWGVGIASINFTGVSGHATRAAIVFPILATLVRQSGTGVLGRVAAPAAGVALAMMVAISRVALHAHSISEVMLGMLLGLIIAVRCWQKNNSSVIAKPKRYYVIATFLIIAAISFALPKFTPHRVLVKISLILSGHDRPYSRNSLRDQQLRHF